MIELATPLTAADKRAKDAVDEAKRAADTATIQSSPAVDGAIARVRAAVLSVGKQDTLDALAALAERSLIQARQYQRRTLFGGDQLRCALVTQGTAIPAYLPASIATALPQLAQLPVRVIAEAHVPQEQGEATGAALKILALGRVVAPSRAKSVN
jgi:hypothetical protein